MRALVLPRWLGRTQTRPIGCLFAGTATLSNHAAVAIPILSEVAIRLNGGETKQPQMPQDHAQIVEGTLEPVGLDVSDLALGRQAQLEQRLQCVGQSSRMVDAQRMTGRAGWTPSACAKTDRGSVRHRTQRSVCVELLPAAVGVVLTIGDVRLFPAAQNLGGAYALLQCRRVSRHASA